MAGFRMPTAWDYAQTFLGRRTVQRLFLAVGVVWGSWKLLRFVARNPARLFFVLVFIAGLFAWGWRWALAAAIIVDLLWGTYRFQSFLERSRVTGWKQILRALWRIWRVKRKFPEAAGLTGLHQRADRGATMRLGHYRGTPRGLVVAAYSGSIGMAERKVFDKVDDLKAALYVDRIRAKPVSSGIVDLHFEYGQHLRGLVGLDAIPLASDPDKFSWGITELGGPLELTWWLSILTGGVTGSGKSGGTWAKLAGLMLAGVPFTVRVVDQDGIEFQVFRMATGSPIVRTYESNLERLGLEGGQQRRGRGRAAAAAAADQRDQQGAFWADVTRDLQTRMDAIPPGQRFWNIGPGTSEVNGLDITLVDELLPFVPQLRSDPFGHATGALNIRGRKPRMVGWYNTQNALAEALGPWRDLVAQRECYRTTSPHMTDTILGSGATQLGARAHELEQGIDDGVCYVRDKGSTYISGRSAWVNDDQTVTISQGQLPDLSLAVTEDPRWVYHLHAGPDAKTPLPEETGVCGHPGRLLYIGSATDVQRRQGEHIRDKGHREPWGQYIDPNRTVADVWPDQTSGFTEEYRQIHRWEDYLPYNESGTRRAGRRERERVPF
jgi:hypothetical protein